MSFSEETRRAIFHNANGRCEKCGERLVYGNHNEGQTGAWEAHHKVSVKSGGSDSRSNGMALCLECHKKTYTYGSH